MDLSRKWLTEFVDVPVSAVNDRDFSEAMTLSGSKVETYEDHGAQFKNVVVGRILAMERHPDSDHMWVTQMDVGEETAVQICTGAWNVHVGDLVPVAKHKSLLPGGVKITKGKLRGISSYGMLCSLAELAVDERDFPYGAIKAAAILGDYHVLKGETSPFPEVIEPGHPIFGKVVAGRVTAISTIAYKMFRCVVDIGPETLEVNTDCQNIHEGDLVPIHSESGVILTPEDLHAQPKEFPHCITDGIFILNEDCNPGDDIPTVLGLDDHVVEFEITPNRPDCLSVIGLAREAAVTFQKPLTLHEPVVKGSGKDVIMDYADVIIKEADLCPRYTGRLVKNVKIGPSPRWMRERLRASGVRPINNIVDITNYVMLEYGQPMHSFDFSCVEGNKLIVRLARPGETVETLDGTARALSESMLVIADEKKPVAVAGVMGGANSEITEQTADVFFESANFNGVSIRKTAMALGMRTEASGRYEKGLDPMNTLPAVERACELVELLECGEVVDGVLDVVAKDFTPTMVQLEPDKINALLGTDVSREEMVKILTDLGFLLLEDDMLVVPSWRGDVSHYSDLAEEVARFVGYNNLPTTLMRGDTTRGGLTDRQKAERQVGEVCRGLGYNEILTYSFIAPAYYNKIRLPENDPRRRSIAILNPLGEETSIMRTTALPSLLETLARNNSHRNPSAKVYEVAKVYLPLEGQDLCDEKQFISLGGYGGDLDFFQFKGAVETIFDSFHIQGVKYTAARRNPSYHPGRCAVLSIDSTVVGVMGQIHPLVCKNYDVEQPMFAAEIDFDALLRARPTAVRYRPLPKFPAVERDIAVVCDRGIPVSDLEDCIRRGGHGLIQEIQLFDIYTGKPIPEDKKSVAFALKLRHEDHTLTDAEADSDVKAVLALLQEELGAVLR
ncbi:MAG: phenylalanine--tRNA ligase subunit beta [Clostridiales bacterium]|nr:MAG: phenylalanine--tRNA ligase subunit beta [Clostridiales bacterium]PWL92568.1 MAG: phenylalanine--tRNA ligase subunit beta [Clostridiales bacterium]